MARRKRTRGQSVKAFTDALIAAWVEDLASEPAPAMPALEAALERCRVGGAA